MATWLFSDGEKVNVGLPWKAAEAGKMWLDRLADNLIFDAPASHGFSWDVDGTAMMTLSSAGVAVIAGGLTITTGGLTITDTGLTVTAGNLDMVAGTLDVQDGGSVSQATDRTTGVTLSKYTGKITTQATSLAAVTLVRFTVTNTLVAATDHVVATKVSGDDDTSCWVESVAAGSYVVVLRNNHASAADTTAFVLNALVIKGAIT